MNFKYIYLAIVPMFFISCNKENDSNLLIEEEISAEESISNSPSFILQNKKSQAIIKEIEKKQNQLKVKLKKAKSKEANKLYDEYSKSLNALIVDLDSNENSSLTIYNTWENAITPDSIKKKMDLYDKLNIKIVENNDGTYHLKYRTGFYYDLFKNKVSRDLKEYLKIAVEHRKKPVVVNGEINQSWSVISDRLIVWENYLKKYPNSLYREEVKGKYLDLIQLYLHGSKKEKSYDLNSKKISPDIEQDYVNTIKKYGKTTTGILTKSFLDYFYTNDKNYTPEEFNKKLTEYTKLEIEKEMKKF